jgi:hypothetical protein
VTRGPWLRPVILANPKAPHQIVLGTDSYSIYVSCTCQREPLGRATRWEPHEPLQLWLAHMAEVRAAA